MAETEKTESASLPEDARTIVGLEPAGIDDNGENVFFGFKVDGGGQIHLHCHHKGLGHCVLFLQMLAKEAQQRRLAIDPTAKEAEIRQTQSNLVAKIDVEVDVSGTTAALLCTTEDGTRIELQLPYDLLQGLGNNAPGMLAEMDRRRAARSQRH